MKNNIELYINNKKVDLSESTKVLFTYKQRDIYSPVAVKNSFSKTITLEGTKTNNDVFNNLYSLNVTYSNGGVQNFNSSKRNPFELYNNGELIESGYMKLDSIKHTGNTIKYNVTLYGGLGDFLYNLMYDSAGNKRTLADLDYGVDMDFNINANQVDTAWKVLNPAFNSWARSVDRQALKKWEYINFMPAYNGISDTIDAEHILVNTNGYDGHMRMWNSNTNRWETIEGFPTQLEGNTYQTVNGYGLAELPKPMNEWQTRDLRSYMQRPVVSMKKIVEAIQNPANNGGYNVVLDADFFNKTNPYYENAWITLPLLNELKEKENQTVIDLPTTIASTPEFKFGSIFIYPINTQQVIPTNASKATFKCKLAVTQSGSTLTNNRLYLAANINNTGIFQKDINKGKQYQAILVQLVCYNQGNVVAGSNAYYLTSEITSGDYMSYNEAGISVDTGGVIKTQVGYFERSGSTNTYVWPEEFEFNVDMSSVKVDHFSILLYYKQKNNGSLSSLYEPFYLYNQRQITSSTGDLPNYRGTFFLKDILNSNLYDRDMKVYSGGEDLGIFSNAKITQKSILTTEYTPADYLLSYTKIFNLFYEKDAFTKTIYIRTMNHFYDGKKINIDSKIDRSKDINITPLAFDKNVYEMEYKTGDTSDIGEKYLEKYGSDFGSQKIYTGYDFDSEKKELYDGVFKNAVQVLQSSKFYTMAKSDTDNETPTFLYNTVTYKLFNSYGETSDVRLVRPSAVDETALNIKSTTSESKLVAPYYDAFDKVQFSNEEEPIDGKDCLVFFNGFREPYIDVNQPFYILSDDIQTMITACDKPCYLYSQSEYNVAEQRICFRLNYLPQFSRYITLDANNEIVYSWDFGETKEVYIPDYKFAKYNTSIYKRYWNNYIQDLYDVDTRIVECYVKFDEKVMQSNLKHYYYFDDNYWVISEIIDYNPDSNEPVKVKFVKVNNFGVYTDYDPADLPSGILMLTVNPTVIGSAQTNVDGVIWIEDGGEWNLSCDLSGVTFSQDSGTGNTAVTITIPKFIARRGIKERVITIYLTKADNSYQTSAKITQKSDYADSTFSVTEFGNYSHSNVPQTGGTCLYTIRSTYPWTVTSDRTYCVPRTSGGTGNTQYGETLEVDWSVSDTYGSRQAILTFTNTLGQIIRLIKGQDGITEEQYLQNDYPQTGGTFTTPTYISGGTVQAKPSWITVTDNEDGSYTLIAQPNTGSTQRTGTVVITAPLPETQQQLKINVLVTQEIDGPTEDFRVEPSSISYQSTGGYQYINIINPNNHNWRIVSADTWYSFNQSQGSVSTTISCYAQPNTGSTVRTSTVVFLDATVGTTRNVTITQYESGVTPSITITPNPLSVDNTGGTKQVTINYVGRSGDFLVATPSSTAITVGDIIFTGDTAIVNITIPANTELTPKTYTVDFTGLYASATLTINQNSGAYLIVEPTSITFDSTGGTATITITTNDSWTIN